MLPAVVRYCKILRTLTAYVEQMLMHRADVRHARVYLTNRIPAAASVVLRPAPDVSVTDFQRFREIRDLIVRSVPSLAPNRVALLNDEGMELAVDRSQMTMCAH